MDFASYDELAQLTLQAQTGHAGAFSALYDKTAPILRLTIAGKVGFADAEDILQEVYLVAWHNLGKIDPQSVVAYLNATARNLCSNHQRARGRAGAAVSVDDEAASLGAGVLADHGGNPADILTQRDVTERLRAALMHDLDDQERDALLLRYYLDMTNAQAAEQLGVSERTVKHIVARALSTLRHKLSFLPVGADLGAALAAAAHGAPTAVAGPDVVGAIAGPGTTSDSAGMQPANSDRRWQRVHQLTAAAAALALLAVAVAAAFLGAPPTDKPAPAPATPAVGQARAFPLCEETGTDEGLTWVRVIASSHPLDRVWCTDADGAIYLPQPIDDPVSPLSATIRSDANESTTAATYFFDLPSGTYELHATDAVGNESRSPLEVVRYPEP